MQPVGPYQFIEAISLCQVGSVWSAIDGQGNSYTVAVLDAAVAGDQRWREAFIGTAQALAQPASGGPRYAHADFAAPAPWVAYASGDGPGAERLFAALGMECRPMQAELGEAESVTVKTPVVGVPGGDSTDDDGLASPTTRLTPGVTPSGPWESGPPQPPHAATTSAPPHQVSVPPDQNSAPPYQNSAPPYQVSVPPDQNSAPPYQTSGAPHQASGPPYQNSAPPYQVSVPPDSISGPPQPLPEMPQAYPSNEPTSGGTSYDPLYSPVRHIVPSEPQPRRTRLWIGIAALVALVLAGGTTIVVLALSGGGDEPVRPTASASSDLPAAELPTSAPLSPGLEPPQPGSWPTQWPRFTDKDDVRTLNNLEGLGFPVKLPKGWDCQLAGRAEGFVRYTCGVAPGTTPEFGGELIVRDCAQPCDEARQVAMRQAEEAWGKRWIRSGQFSAYAETSSIEENGQPRHGLVVVAFFRSGAEGVVDRQLVFRMTGPRNGAQELRRVANYIRDALVF